MAPAERPGTARASPKHRSAVTYPVEIEAIRHETPDEFERLASFGKELGEHREDVWHAVPSFEFRGNAVLSSPFHEPLRIVEQNFGGADVNRQRRQTGEVAEQR